MSEIRLLKPLGKEILPLYEYESKRAYIQFDGGKMTFSNWFPTIFYEELNVAVSTIFYSYLHSICYQMCYGCFSHRQETKKVIFEEIYAFKL